MHIQYTKKISSITIGIYGISSQSGRAFLADYLNEGYKVIGYARPTNHGKEIVDAINTLHGLYLERPANSNHELSKFIELGENCVTTDLKYLVKHSDILILAIPSTAHVSAIKEMKKYGLQKRVIPIVLSPSRSIATPYIWKELGDRYPIICLSTCPYSCKAPAPAKALIKRRKRTFIASLEGDVTKQQADFIRALFPQAALSSVPALTSLNNIGAVFHCATYMMNIDEIKRRQLIGENFSFYIDGIAKRPEVGKVLEQIDQIRLQIANLIGIRTFGLQSNPREDIWQKLTYGLRALEEESADDISQLRQIRKEFTEYLDNCVISAQHWLDITYGVERIHNEDLVSAIARTPTYQNNSIPQIRYVTEDIPTGLVVYESLAQWLNIDCKVISKIIDAYNKYFNTDARKLGRNLKEFDKDYILRYLKGE